MTRSLTSLVLLALALAAAPAFAQTYPSKPVRLMIEAHDRKSFTVHVDKVRFDYNSYFALDPLPAHQRGDAGKRHHQRDDAHPRHPLAEHQPGQ